VPLLILVYRLLLYLYPADFRREFGDEMTAVFSQRIEDAGGGSGLLLTVAGHELASLIGRGLQERIFAWRSPPTAAAATGGGSVPLPGAARMTSLASCLVMSLVILVLAFLGSSLAQRVAANFTFQPPASVQQVALADFNGNGHLDAYLAVGHGSMPYPDHILFNDGTGQFGNTSRQVGNWISFSVAAGDLTGNGFADILLDITGGGLVLYLNYGHTIRPYGSAGFSGYLAEPGPKAVMRLRPTLGDLTGDGRLDIFAAGCCGREAGMSVPRLSENLLSYSQVWLNNGGGSFSHSGQYIGQMGSNAAALADLNGNGRLDVFLANGRTLDAAGNYYPNTPNTVWFNDGTGQFNDSGQRLGGAESTAVAVGDLNGNGFVDAVVGNRTADEIWFNDGQGNFSDSGQRLAHNATRAVFLSDVDGDGDLDLFVAGATSGQVWFNDGSGRFMAGQRIRYGQYDAVALGDVTGDGRIEVLVAGVNFYRIWRWQGDGRFRDDPRVNYR
jgi:hypothetical protein